MKDPKLEWLGYTVSILHPIPPSGEASMSPFDSGRSIPFGWPFHEGPHPMETVSGALAVVDSYDREAYSIKEACPGSGLAKDSSIPTTTAGAIQETDGST